MKTLYYFAYGSNLLSRRLRSRIGRAVVFRKHILQDYRLVFNCGGFANIEPSKGHYVEGILYEITSEELNELDIAEGFYKKEFFDLKEGGLGVVYIGLDHVVRRSYNNVKLDYINIILDGLLEHELYETYNQVLSFKIKNFQIKKSKHKKLF